MAMLPLDVNAANKKIHIKDIKALTMYGTTIDITVSEPYFQDYPYSDGLIFKTPTKMVKDFRKDDKFTISIRLEENEIRYLSQFESVPFIYPPGFINSDSDNTFYSTLDVRELLRAIKASKDSDKKREDNKLENKVMDFFGIDR
jgi:hypothetical protein